METYKDKLPPRYESWIDLWNRCKDTIKQHDAIFISFVEGQDKYETTVDFIKARCFEEFTEEYKKLKGRIGGLYSHVDDYTPSFVIIRDIDRLLKLNP